MAQKYISREGQSIFDIGVMLNGGIENIVKFSIDNGIESLTDTIPTNTNFTYTDNGLALTSWIKKNGYVFSTQPYQAPIGVPFSFTLTSLFSDGHSWRFVCDDTGMLTSIDLGVVAGFDTEINLRSLFVGGHTWKFKVDDTGMLFSQDLGITSEPNTVEILRSIAPMAHKWAFYVDDTGQLMQPGTDLGI